LRPDGDGRTQGHGSPARYGRLPGTARKEWAILHKINQARRDSAVEACEGEIGSVADLLFDETRWVVDTCHWLLIGVS
jgi:hypothetical protein